MINPKQSKSVLKLRPMNKKSGKHVVEGKNEGSEVLSDLKTTPAIKLVVLVASSWEMSTRMRSGQRTNTNLKPENTDHAVSPRICKHIRNENRSENILYSYGDRRTKPTVAPSFVCII